MATKTPAQVLTEINAKFPGKLIRGSDESLRIRRVSTGFLAFDRLTGGGVPLGRYSEFYGEESTLKSTTASIIVAAFQNQYPDKRVMWFDAEGSLDPSWMERFGVDLERLDVIPRPDVGEAVTHISEIAMKSKAYCLIVIDSVAALIPGLETEYEPRDVNKAMGAAGRMNSAMLRRLTRLLDEDISVILINQMRDAIGGMMFGDPARPTGGRAIKYYMGHRIEFRQGETQKTEVPVFGAGGTKKKRRVTTARVVNLRMVKDKCGPRENQVASVLWHPDSGSIDEEESILAIGIEDGIVARNAQTITFYPNKKKLKQNVTGWNAAKQYLDKNEKMSSRLRKAITRRSAELGHSHE